MTNRPNILFIVLDTQRRDHLPSYGYAHNTAPHLAAWAGEMMQFQRAIAPAQWTIPAHGSLFTGLYPSQHGLTQITQRLSGAHPTLAEILRAAGYQTVAFCNNPLLGVVDHGLRRGFNAFYDYAGAAVTRPRDAQAGALQRAWQRRFGAAARHISTRFALDNRLLALSMQPWLVPLWTRFARFKGQGALALRDLVDYWRAQRAGGGAPLFAFVNLMGTHLPYHPAQATLRQVAPDVARSAAQRRFAADYNRRALEWISPRETPLADWQVAALLGHYDAEIYAQDAQLGAALAALKAQGALDNTLLILVADHGEGHGEHGYFGHSFVVHQELVRVPLWLRYPDGRGAGQLEAQAISTRRLFHTALDWADVQPPLAADDPNGDVRALTLGNSTAEAAPVFSEAYPPANLLGVLEQHGSAQIARLGLRQVRRSVDVGDYRLLAQGDAPMGLYHAYDDPAEQSDLRAALPEVVRRLSAQLAVFAHTHANSATSPLEFAPAVQATLRALGYLE